MAKKSVAKKPVAKKPVEKTLSKAEESLRKIDYICNCLLTSEKQEARREIYKLDKRETVALLQSCEDYGISRDDMFFQVTYTLQSREDELGL